MYRNSCGSFGLVTGPSSGLECVLKSVQVKYVVVVRSSCDVRGRGREPGRVGAAIVHASADDRVRPPTVTVILG